MECDTIATASWRTVREVGLNHAARRAPGAPTSSWPQKLLPSRASTCRSGPADHRSSHSGPPRSSGFRSPERLTAASPCPFWSERTPNPLVQGITGKFGNSRKTHRAIRHRTSSRRHARQGRPARIAGAPGPCRCSTPSPRPSSRPAPPLVHDLVPPPFAGRGCISESAGRDRARRGITEGIPVLDGARPSQRTIAGGCQSRVPHRSELPRRHHPRRAARSASCPATSTRPGNIGVVSRSGTLTYEAVWQLTGWASVSRPASASAATPSTAWTTSTCWRCSKPIRHAPCS